jgi:hypothetical protein
MSTVKQVIAINCNHAGLLVRLRFERVDNLGAYSIPPGDQPFAFRLFSSATLNGLSRVKVVPQLALSCAAGEARIAAHGGGLLERAGEAVAGHSTSQPVLPAVPDIASSSCNKL